MSRHVADATQRVAEMGAAGQLVHVFFFVSTRPLGEQLEAAKNKENSIEQSIFYRG